MGLVVANNMASWLFIALIAPALWAIVNLIDVYFVDSVYTDAYDGAIISGTFQVLPWLLVVGNVWQFTLPPAGSIHLFMAGIFFIWSTFFYFKALFAKNDAPIVQLLWNLTIPVTMLLAWVWYADTLTVREYLGCFLVLIGVMMLQVRGTFSLALLRSLLAPMSGAIIFLSCSMVLASHGYEVAQGRFFDNYLVFALGSLCGTAAFVLPNPPRIREKLNRVMSLSRRYFFVFLLAELLALIGTICSQRALDLSPSSALVATLESTSPVFVILFSLMSILYFRFGAKTSIHTQKVYSDQMHGYPLKMLCSLIISTGVYILST